MHSDKKPIDGFLVFTPYIFISSRSKSNANKKQQVCEDELCSLCQMSEKQEINKCHISPQFTLLKSQLAFYRLYNLTLSIVFSTILLKNNLEMCRSFLKILGM